jgi:hypothetical protein
MGCRFVPFFFKKELHVCANIADVANQLARLEDGIEGQTRDGVLKLLESFIRSGDLSSLRPNESAPEIDTHYSKRQGKSHSILITSVWHYSVSIPISCQFASIIFCAFE